MTPTASTHHQTVRIERAVVLELSDGTRLVSDVYHPPGPGKHPVLLMRQPYGREIASTVVYAQPEFFARAGFLVVIQDVRGRGDSDGRFHAFRDEAQDGCETIEWAARLPGADGRVCMYGFSYQAYTQIAVLKERPSALVAIAPHMAAADLYGGWFYKNGILRLSTTISWACQMLRADAWRSGHNDLAEELEERFRSPGPLLARLPLAERPPFSDERLPAYAAEWLTHETRDAYWDELDGTSALAESDIPVFHLGGYYDFYSEGTVEAYLARKNKKRDFFLLGPWSHIPWKRWNGGHDFGPDVRIDTDQLLVDWLKAQLDQAEPAASGVRYFVLGSNQWRNATFWPPENTRARAYFLSSNGRANSLFGDGRLTTDPLGGPSDHFVYDPEVPVLAPAPAWGPADLRDAQQGNNLLCYELEDVGDGFAFAGHPRLTLYVASTAAETDFVARLSWVREDGRSSFISLAAARLSQGREHSSGVFELELTFEACALFVAPTENLRLDIASSAFPLLIRHPNTDESPAKVKQPNAFQRARQTVYHEAGLLSKLSLPILSEC